MQDLVSEDVADHLTLYILLLPGNIDFILPCTFFVWLNHNVQGKNSLKIALK